MLPIIIICFDVYTFSFQKNLGNKKKWLQSSAYELILYAHQICVFFLYKTKFGLRHPIILRTFFIYFR